MQKDYRAYTVGELLDMGLEINVYNHNGPSEREAYQLLKQFEGIQRRYYTVDRSDGSVMEVVNGWTDTFSIKNFLEAKK